MKRMELLGEVMKAREELLRWRLLRILHAPTPMRQCPLLFGAAILSSETTEMCTSP